MARPNLETELLNEWNQIVDGLTPAERQMLAKSTPADWFGAIAELVRDPGFWRDLGTSFLNGVSDGLEEFSKSRN